MYVKLFDLFSIMPAYDTFMSQQYGNYFYQCPDLMSKYFMMAVGVGCT